MTGWNLVRIWVGIPFALGVIFSVLQWLAARGKDGGHLSTRHRTVVLVPRAAAVLSFITANPDSHWNTNPG